MKYSNFHKDKNPFSPARLDEAFKASKLEGGPGDPVKVTVKKDQAAGEVTITKSSEGKGKKPLTPEEKKAASNRWSNMSEEDKQAARDRKAEREALSSFTYKKLDYHESPKMKLMDEDMDIELAPPPDDYLPPEDTPTTSTTKTTESSKEKNKKKKKDTYEYPEIKGDGLTQCTSEDPTACGLDMTKELKSEEKAETKAYKKAQKDRSYRTKRDGTQVLKKQFAPGKWFEEKMYQRGINKTVNQAKKERAKKNRISDREYRKSNKNTPIKDFFNDLSVNNNNEEKTKKIKNHRTIKASF